MRYISTRGGGQPLGFSEVVLAGLARDGGLYLPESIPDVSALLPAWEALNYRELAFEIMRLFATDLPADVLRALIERSYATFRHVEVTPLRRLGQLHLLELFHGPTLAFKDVALQFLGNLFEYLLESTGGEMNIVAATSGDTGSAAIHGVAGKKGMRIFVMYPEGRVSAMQERQMTTVLAGNVNNLAVAGTFDDCQRIVKELFNDLEFRDHYHLGAVNSINWARILAQVVYYFYAALRLSAAGAGAPVSFSVPTGNFGDIFAGYLAYRMGLPIGRLILASNENDILARYFGSGTYSSGTVVPTLSPSMDIQVASNFERYLYYLAGEDGATLSSWMATFAATGTLVPPNAPLECFAAMRGDSALTLETIRSTWEQYGYLLDPHTALGVAAARHYSAQWQPLVALATAHPAKFGDAIRRALGTEPLTHPLLEALAQLPVRVTQVAASRSAVARLIAERIDT